MLADYYKNVKDKFVSIHAIKIYRVIGGIAPLILNLGTKRR